MEQFFFPLTGYKMFLQIDKNFSEIKVVGSHIYYLCGKETKVFVVDVNNEVYALVLEGGYPYSITVRSYGNGFIRLYYQVFTRKAGANPCLLPNDKDFTWSVQQVL